MQNLEAMTPQERLRLTHQQGVHRFARMDIPLYGLPLGWTGMRATGGCETETGVTHDEDGRHVELFQTASLVHEDGASLLVVESSDKRLPIDDRDLLGLLGADGRCDLRTVSLDGRDIAFASASTGDRVVLRWVGYAATVTVVAERWPMAFGLRLVRITDLEPYHEGRLRMLETRSGFDLH